MYQVAEAVLAEAKQHGSARMTADAHTALGIIAASNNELAVAKQFLFQAVVDPTLCPRALHVLCSLGLVQLDETLALAAIGESEDRK
jgi:hypothetical protein